MRIAISYFISIMIGAFGLLTLFLSSSVIFDLFGIREAEGNYVPFVVWANFICSLIYIIAAYGFATQKKWTSVLLGTSVIVLAGAFIALLVHINSGGIHETKTIGAMVFRIVLTMAFTILSYMIINKKKT